MPLFCYNECNMPDCQEREIMRIGVCDDEKEVREFIKEKVNRLLPKAEVILYESGQEVLCEKTLTDILFLDIQMPGTNGMETAKILRKTDKKTVIIFVTAIEEYVFQAFDVDAFHYLVKPFTNEKFYEVLQKAVKRCHENQEQSQMTDTKQSFMIISHGKHIVVYPDDIVYAEVFDRKVMLHTLCSDIEYYGKMKELEKKVGEDFFRPHRAYLINFRYVKKYDSTTIWLEKGQVLMAKQNYQEFVKAYLRFNRRMGNLT